MKMAISTGNPEKLSNLRTEICSAAGEMLQDTPDEEANGVNRK